MTELEKYERVNKCETLDELADAIESFADESGLIKGKTRFFNADKMSNYCRTYSYKVHNTLTREYGIRQQALYILFYNYKQI